MCVEKKIGLRDEYLIVWLLEADFSIHLEINYSNLFKNKFNHFKGLK